MKLFTNKYPAPKYSINSTDIHKWINNTLVFLYPLAALYFTQVIGSLGQEGHVITLQDLIPSSFTIGGSVLYIYNAVFDIYRKFVDGQKNNQ